MHSPATHVTGCAALRVTVSGGPDRRTVTAVGDVDIATVGSFRDALWWGVSGPVRLVRVDLAGVEFLSAAALTALLEAHHRAVAGGARLVLIHPARMHLRVFAFAGLDRVLSIEQPYDEPGTAGS